MPYNFEEPRPAPRGPELVSIEARRRVNINRQLEVNTVPRPNGNQVGYRFIIAESLEEPLKPYTNTVSEGLENLLDEVTKG